MKGTNFTSATHVQADESQPAQSAAMYLKRPYANSPLSRQRLGGLPISNRGIFRQRSRYLRRRRTKAERALWKHLRGRQLGVRFRQQVRLWGAYPDFYAAEVLLVVEVDGPAHRAPDARGRKQRAWDAARDTRLRRLGYLVVRFANEAVLWNHREVVRELQTIIARRRVELAR